MERRSTMKQGLAVRSEASTEHFSLIQACDPNIAPPGRSDAISAVVRLILCDSHQAPEDYLSAFDTQQQGE
jgi:hypothetical protein